MIPCLQTQSKGQTSKHYYSLLAFEEEQVAEVSDTASVPILKYPSDWEETF